MADIVDILNRFGELEWYAIRPAELSTGEVPVQLFPPVISFRYKEVPDDDLQLLKSLLYSYRGQTTWVLRGDGMKKFCLTLQRIDDLTNQGEAETLMDAVDKLIDEEPETVRTALRDFPNLVAFIDKAQSQFQRY